MKKKYTKAILSFCLAFFALNAYAQNSNFWSKTSKERASVNELHFRKTIPNKANYYTLNAHGLKQALLNAPIRGEFQGESSLIIGFPNANGDIENYRIVEASVMEDELQAKYPTLKSYAGESTQNPGKLIRFSLTNKGLHAMSFSSKNGVEFIDPFSKIGNNYVVYSKKDLPMLENGAICHYENSEEDNERLANIESASFNANDGRLRDFRIAIATTIEYSEFHWLDAGLSPADTEADKRTAVMDAIVVTMTRNNFVYERDLSITMTLVANNDIIVFINSDNFNNDDAGTLINQSQSVIDANIGNANYDIGHTFSTGGGGLAQLNSPCVTGSKARGITGLPAPIGDAYDIDFVAHELGHQFGSPHTFNGSTGSCQGGNRSASNAYEVGSGTTIMAYAGICAPQNVQNNSDAYFHQRSLFLIFNNVFSGNSTCANQTVTGNVAPVANAGANFTIPSSTPYRLTGSSTDVDGIATHTYTWEQYDLGPAGLPAATNTTGPLVRSFEGTDNPTRFIPRLQDLYFSGGGSTEWEVLASVSRPINFRLTVRDNDGRGGNTAIDNMTATTVAAAGPFRVTSQNTDELVLTPNTTETVTWDVAGTTGNGINTANVNILLSTDGGLTYGTTLASNVPNDGSHDITVPNIQAPQCRIMVEGAGNIFFNVNDKFFAIGNFQYVNTCNDYTINPNVPVPKSNTQFTVFNVDVPDSASISDLDVAVNISHDTSGGIFIAFIPPYNNNQVRMVSGACVGPQDIIVTYDDEGAATDCSATNTNQNVTPVQPLSSADGQDSLGNWRFLITDVNLGGSSATLNSATFRICSTQVVSLSTDEFSLEDSFTIFPNPNIGKFTVNLSKTQSSDVQLEVNDIRGRKIFNTSYEVNGTMNETVNLGSIQSGIYLVTVIDGTNKSTKKIVIE